MVRPVVNIFEQPQQLQARTAFAAFADEIEKIKAETPSQANQFSSAPSWALSDKPRVSKTDKDSSVYSQLLKLAGTYKLKLNNNAAEKIDTSRLVVIFYGSKYQETVWPKYKFGETMIGDGHGAPLSITLPGKTHYKQVDQFMQDVQDAFLGGDRFTSTSVQSHGIYDGWAGSETERKFPFKSIKHPIEFNVFDKIKDYKGEDAPFYKHTRLLELGGCLTFGQLDADEIAYLRNLAQEYDVELIGNTTFSKGTWGKDEDGRDIAAETGPGGYAFDFKPNGGIYRVLRPRDDETYADTIKCKDYPIDISELKKVWEAQFINDPKLKAEDFEIDQRRAPSQMTYGAPGQETVVYYALPAVYTSKTLQNPPPPKDKQN